jgi:hypothetical protein
MHPDDLSVYLDFSLFQLNIYLLLPFLFHLYWCFQLENNIMKLILYPRALENRVRGADPSLTASRRRFLGTAATRLLMLQFLFLGLFSYIYGCLFQQSSHVHKMNILFVDYDGGSIGNAIRQSYANLQGNNFPTLIQKSVSDFPHPSNLRSMICDGNHWAAIYIQAGASAKLQSVLSGDSVADSSVELTYIWNEARYPAIADTLISQNVELLSSAARVAYVSSLGADGLQPTSGNRSATFVTLASPWSLNSINIQPTTQGSRLIYNTLVIILIIIQEFFYVGALNAIYIQFKIYTRIHPLRIIVYRTVISLVYTFIGSLCSTGAMWAFRATWNVNSNQFALTWAVLWLFAHINYQTLDVFTIWIPPTQVPMAFITWVVFNSASVLVPIELMPMFYRWVYAIPANELYRVLIDIWSGGCNRKLHIALPVLFSWQILLLLLSSLGVYRRCHLAVIEEEMQKEASHARLNAVSAPEKGGYQTAGVEPENLTSSIAISSL